MEKIVKTLDEGKEEIIDSYINTFLRSAELAKEEGLDPITYTGLMNTFLVDIIRRLTNITSKAINDAFAALFAIEGGEDNE